MKLSLYGQYIAERQGRGILETKHGFATFDFINEDTVYIVDLYVIPKKRKSHIAKDIADKICEIAIQSGRKYLLGSVDASAKGAEDSKAVLEAYGMRIHKVVEPMIFYIKQIAPIEAEVV